MPKRYTIEDMQTYVINYGGKCLSKEYINAATLLKWRCEKDHTWEADFQIIRQGSWCQQCAKQNRKEQILEDIKAIAAKRRIKCLSRNEEENVYQKIYYQCH